MFNSIASRYIPPLVSAFRADWLIYAVVVAYVAIGSVIVLAAGGAPLGMLESYARTWLVNFGIVAPLLTIFVGGVHITHRLDSRRRLAYRHMLAPDRVARFIAGTILMLTAGILFMSTFSALKTAMPVGGFPYDVLQADIDKLIHFGADPWRWLYAIGPQFWLQRLLEINYNSGWFVLCYGLLFWWATSFRATARLRYFLTFFLVWVIVGNVLAYFCLSAGPAFYGRVTGDTARFGELLGYLRASHGEFSSSTTYQAYLWWLHKGGNVGIGSGISAFPSMHVALITLNALFIGELSRRWGLVMWAFVGLILVSSVYLAWHYAIDGYASIAITTALYFAVKKLFPLLARLRWRSADPVPTGATTS